METRAKETQENTVRLKQYVDEANQATENVLDGIQNQLQTMETALTTINTTMLGLAQQLVRMEANTTNGAAVTTATPMDHITQ